jgi:hypothetical protein
MSYARARIRVNVIRGRTEAPGALEDSMRSVAGPAPLQPLLGRPYR